MIKRFNFKSDFTRNVVILMSGTTMAQAIPIAISPILTRIYSPEDFGTLALFVSITGIFSAIITGKYELAIMLPKKEIDAINIFFLSLMITCVMSLSLLFVIFLFHDYLVELLNNRDISQLLYLIPLSVLLVGLYNSCNYWLNREKKYKSLSIGRVYQSLTTASTNIMLGFSKVVNPNLIIGVLLGQLVGLYILITKLQLENLFKNVSKLKMLAMAKKYRKFPEITLPHTIFSSLSMNLPIFIITYYFSSKETGFFSFASKIVMLPITLISSAYYQVFFESFSKEKDKELFFKQKFKTVNLIFIPIFTILFFLLPNVFSFVFGEKWGLAGGYAQVLLPLFYLKFISNLFTTTTYIYYEKQLENFKLGILIMCLVLISLLIGSFYQDIKLGLILMSISNGMVILFKIYRSFTFVKIYK